MNFVITLLQDVFPYLHTQSLLGRISWFAFFFLLLIFLIRTRRFKPQRQPSYWALFLVFIVVEAVSTLFLGFEIALDDSIPLIGQIGRQESVTWMAFSQIPVVLSAGFLGPIGSAVVGAVSGLIYAGFETHNPFTILEFAFLGSLLGVFLHQHYRTRFFRWVASPFVSSLLLSFIYPVIYLVGIILWLDDAISDRLDYAVRLLVPGWLAIGGSLIIGGIVAELVSKAFQRHWGSRRPFVPSPAEESIEVRSFTLMGLVVAGLAILLSVIGWFVAYDSALQVVENRVSGTASFAASSVPTALEIGQNLILSSARDPMLNNATEDALQAGLDSLQSSSVFFRQMIVVDVDGRTIAVSGAIEGSSEGLFQAEGAGVDLATAGVPFQYYTNVLPEPSARTILSFIAPITENGRILIGRSIFDENPFTTPLLISLDDLQGLEGAGIMLDENRLILHHPVRAMIGTQYSGELSSEGGLTNGVASDGSQVLVYAKPVVERSWVIVIEVPVRIVQEQALGIAGPLVVFLLALAIVSTLLLRIILRFVTTSLRNLAVEANRIAENPVYLDSPLRAGGVDEVGVMRSAFERLRVSLKSRMDEQRQLLLASHGAASSLDFNSSVKPLLNAALTNGAGSARVVLTAGALPELGFSEAQTFGAGTRGNQYAYLDSQILHLNKEESPLVIRNPIANTELRFMEGKPIPLSILAIPLVQEKMYFGTLWIAYNRPHVVSEDEVRFMSTLGGQGALAVANARLFMGAEIGRERLASILTSTPDPVIVTDQNGKLLLANPASWTAFGDVLESNRGEPIVDLIEDPALTKLLTTKWQGTYSMDIVAPDSTVFFAKATSVMLKNREIGTVCVMRDVTRFKKLDDMKSEFVSAVSHDLKTPLVIMRSYATMVSMVGDLSEEQMSYIHKITYGVDRMAKLVEDLLHLGKFEMGFELELEKTSPTGIVSTVIENLQPLAKQKKIKLTADISSVIGVQLEADKLFLERAVSNLVDNAIKYSEEDGQVVISVQPLDNGEMLRFSVSDNGIGIANEDQERLFEKFFRAKDRKTRKQLGSGLGLSIVKSIVDAHHGSIGIESIQGKGSKFTFILPLRQPVKQNEKR